jgi:class 3 adenylate cyclase/tetratricopeptide (TPR) repeat protein
MKASPESHSSSGSTRGLEIAHVLFMDIVSYSQLTIDDQTRLVQQLQEIVRNTTEFGLAQKRRQLLRLPAGDGMALVFFGDAEAAARCAFEISLTLRDRPELPLRMGIHVGPVQRMADINANRNVAGGGINIAQRVMGCGDSGHILISKTVADVLDQLATWKAALHDLGEVEVKHGLRLHIYNLYTDEAGNSKLPMKFREARKGRARSRAKRWFLGTVGSSVVLASLFFLFHRGTAHALRERDTIVLADFANKTTDSVFGEALKQGLTFELNQSPFLNILNDQKVREELLLMGRSPSDTLTPELAREVCLRSGSKAMLLGSIWSMGHDYVIGLKAVNCRDGDSLAEEQVEAKQREEVIASLHQAGTSIRSKLGESLSSIQRFDAPLQKATTASLEALQAYSRAIKTSLLDGERAAVPLYEHAIEIDPRFAAAYADLAVIYNDLNQPELSAENAQKAYELSANVTELEKFRIDSAYYMYAIGDQEKATKLYEEWKKVYPQDLSPYIQTGLVDTYLGRLEQALQNDQDGLRLAERMKLTQQKTIIYEDLAYDYTYLDRLDEARKILDEAHTEGFDEPLLPLYYQLAFLTNDTKEMERCANAAAGKPGDEDALLYAESDTDAFHGKLKQARILSQRAVKSALNDASKEVAAEWQVSAALREAEFGNASEAREEVKRAFALSSNRDVEIAGALAFAWAKDLGDAERLITQLEKDSPENTLLVRYWSPTIRAMISLHKNNPAQAIRDLDGSSMYELGGAPPPFSSGAGLYPTYVRGEAYLETKQWREATSEFQILIEHQGLVWNSPLGTLARLQLARAYAGTADPRARNAYEQFLAVWRDADPDILALREAKKEYAKLK